MATALATQDNAERPTNPLVTLRNELEQRAAEFKMVLPSHIPPEKLQRTIITAVQQNPALLQCDRRSLITAAFKAAQDGLLPDGREAAFVQFTTRRKNPQTGNFESVKEVQYMPMVWGLRKKILQSEEVTDIFAAVVYRQEIEGDKPRFIYEEGTERMLRHKPILDPAFDPKDEDIALAYSVATFADGSKSFEVMRRSEINKVRQCSQTGALGQTVRFGKDAGKPIEPKGPWVDWFSEQAKKTVIRRHSKSLPQSGDVFLDVEARDDAALSTTALLDSQPGGQPAIEDHSAGDEDLPPHSEDGELIEGNATDTGGEADTGKKAAKPKAGKAREKPEPAAADEPPADEGQGGAEPADDQQEDEEHPAAAKAREIAEAYNTAGAMIDLNSLQAKYKIDLDAMPGFIREDVEAVFDANAKRLRDEHAAAVAAQARADAEDADQ